MGKFEVQGMRCEVQGAVSVERLVKTKDKSKKLRNAVTKSRLGGDKSVKKRKS